MTMRIPLFVLALAVVIGLPSCGGKSSDAPLAVCTPRWQENSANPVIGYGQALSGIIWNDPSVMQEGSSYRMWLSGGTAQGINHVRIYQATSPDGTTWSIDTTPLLGPNPTITVTSTAAPDPSGLYTMATETDFYGGQPHFSTGSWHLWYLSGDDAYYLSSAPGNTATSWKNSSTGTILDGVYAPVSGVTGTAAVRSDWDGERTETPMVVKAGGTYHLYYTGGKIGASPGVYEIGHATSPDGTTWTKDPANPVLSYHSDPAKWGFYLAAEPGVVYDNGTFYLYYVTARMRPGGYTGDQALQMGIALATSTDGSLFTPYDANNDGELDPVLVQSANYPVSSNYVGYSTPYPLIDSSGRFHLFYDVAQYVNPGDWRQVALAHATSKDGYAFTETEHDIFTYGTGDWKDYEARSPAVLQQGDVFKMWFAGNNTPFQPGFVIGIGYATFGANCH